MNDEDYTLEAFAKRWPWLKELPTWNLMAHPHANCPTCKTEQDAHEGAFVVACQQLYRGSFSELYEKLVKRGFRISKQEPETQKPPGS